MTPRQEMPEFSFDGVEMRRAANRLAQAISLKPAETGRPRVFQSLYAIHDFFLFMARDEDRGYALGATVFRQAADRLERTVRSRFLTALADVNRECLDRDRMSRRGIGGSSLPGPDSSVYESQYAEFARFVRQLLPGDATLLVAWAEDMNTDDSSQGLEMQPTALIRGVFFSPLLDQRLAVDFWDQAAVSPSFPCRVFDEPCDPDDGVMLSSYHTRVIAEVFSVVSEAAVEHFAGHLRRHLRDKILFVWVEPSADNPTLRPRWQRVRRQATPDERRAALTNITASVTDVRRRDWLQAYLTAEP